MTKPFVHLLFPAFTRSVPEQLRRKNALERWFRKSWRHDAEENGWRADLQIGWPGEASTQKRLLVSDGDDMVVPEDPMYGDDDLKPKGMWVRESLQNVLGRLHEQSYRERSYVVHVDGSGKIEYDMAITVMKHLTSGDQLILGYRENPAETMAESRVAVERFENFLIEQKFEISLPDAQCGCWGFASRLLRKMPIIAQTYGIEADVVISALSAGIEPRYVPVRLVKKLTAGGMKQTDYRSDEDLRKMHFLLFRLELPPATLPGMLKYFEKRHGNILPSEYRERICELANGEGPQDFISPVIYP